MKYLVSLPFLLLLSACSESPPDEPPIIRPIAWTSAETHTFEQVRRLAGVVEPVETASLSFLVGGKVDSVSVKLGQRVTQGEELAQLEQKTFNLNYQSAQASLEQANASFIERRNEYNRYAELVEQGVVSKSGFDAAKAAFDSARSAKQVAETQVDIASKDLQDSRLLAPYDGIITQRIIEPSQRVSPGQGVFEIEGQGGLEVQITVPETIIQEISAGISLPVNFPALPNTSLQGVVTEVGARAERANAFPVTLVLQELVDDLRAGMTAEVDVTFEGIGRTGYRGYNPVKIPVSSVIAGEGQKAYVFVFDEEASVVRQRQVQTENILDNYIFISSGLAAGEIIATAGVGFLRDGQAVTLLERQIELFN